LLANLQRIRNIWNTAVQLACFNSRFSHQLAISIRFFPPGT
jgi:hypothetical protein